MADGPRERVGEGARASRGEGTSGGLGLFGGCVTHANVSQDVLVNTFEPRRLSECGLVGSWPYNSYTPDIVSDIRL